MWQFHRRDESDALSRYKAGLSLGYTKGLTDLFDASGLKFSFEQEHLENLINEVNTALDELPA
jgi:hypothetical protein